jgi:hypothetical protein
MASELLKVALHPTCSNSEVKLIDGASGKSYVILSTFDLYIDDDDGGTDHYIYKTQALAANATFEHTSKIVLNAGDMLGFITGGAADVDVVVNYLEQTL